MALNGDEALALAKSYTRQTAEGMGAVKGQDGFSPIIRESTDNTQEVYKLNIQTATGSITTPNLKGKNGQDGTDGINGTNGITPHIDTATKHWFIGTVDTGVVAVGKDGAQGIQGERGIPGLQGIQGIQGIPGEKGDDGYPFLIYKEYNNLSEFQSSDFPQIGLLFMVNSGENERPVYRVTGESEQPYSFVTNLSGAEGIKGEQGEPGKDGIQGVPGEPGKDGTTYTPSIGTVNTLEPNANASASVSVDEEMKTAQFDFSLPRGVKGEEGLSPTISVNTDTESEYTLDITDKNGTFTTPNLRKEGTRDYEHLINLPKVNGITLTGNKTLEDLGIAKAITDAIGNVTQISFEVVESFAALPTIGEVGTFYLVPNIARANNNYNEYIWDVNNLQYELIGTIQSDIDLSNYYTKAEVNTLVGGIQSKIERKTLVNTDTLKIIAKDGICYAYLRNYTGTLGTVQTGIPQQYYPIFDSYSVAFNYSSNTYWLTEMRISKNSGVIYLRYYLESNHSLNDFTNANSTTNGTIQWFYGT